MLEVRPGSKKKKEKKSGFCEIRTKFHWNCEKACWAVRPQPENLAQEAQRSQSNDTPVTADSGMAELRHATAAAAATRASSSPAKRDAESSASSSPFVASSSSPRGGGGGDGKDGAPRSSAPLHHQKYHFPSPLRSLLALEDPRSPTASASYRILVAVVACLFVAALVSAPSVWSRIVSS